MWTCNFCEEENLDEDEVCCGCGSLKEESSYDAYADEMDEEFEEDP